MCAMTVGQRCARHVRISTQTWKRSHSTKLSLSRISRTRSTSLDSVVTCTGKTSNRTVPHARLPPAWNALPRNTPITWFEYLVSRKMLEVWRRNLHSEYEERPKYSRNEHTKEKTWPSVWKISSKTSNALNLKSYRKKMTWKSRHHGIGELDLPRSYAGTMPRSSCRTWKWWNGRWWMTLKRSERNWMLTE